MKIIVLFCFVVLLFLLLPEFHNHFRTFTFGREAKQNVCLKVGFNCVVSCHNFEQLCVLNAISEALACERVCVCVFVCLCVDLWILGCWMLDVVDVDVDVDVDDVYV